MISAWTVEPAGERRSPSPTRRLAAGVALTAGAGTAVVAATTVWRDPGAGLAATLALAVAVLLAWEGALEVGRRRGVRLAAAAAAVAVALVLLGAPDLTARVLLVVAGVALTTLAIRVAYGKRGSAGGSWQRVPPPLRPVLLINPRAGDGAAVRNDLGRHARARGVTPLVLGPGDDLEELARRAVADGADSLGMAGGDGSMSTVAAIAAEHDLPFVCVPAGTRNHFALDLGVRRTDVVGALDAFTDGVESRVDLGSVNGRTFVNNVSLGLYADAVQVPGYRSSKVRTLVDSARSVLRSTGPAPSLLVVDDLGTEHHSPLVVLVSNNPYALRRVLGRGTRPRIDTGRLGMVVLDRARTSRAWEVPATTLSTPAGTAAAVDGEAVVLDAPLRLSARPKSLRVRISVRHPGISPSGLLPPTLGTVVTRLVAMAAGRSPGGRPTSRRP